jgi:hypothetical protein
MIALHDISNVNCPGIARVWEDVKRMESFHATNSRINTRVWGYMGIGLAVAKDVVSLWVKPWRDPSHQGKRGAGKGNSRPGCEHFLTGPISSARSVWIRCRCCDSCWNWKSGCRFRSISMRWSIHT